jgi:hypothetical protein
MGLNMSLRILLDDKINKLLEDNPDLNNLDKNKFEKAVASIINVRHLHGIDFDDLVKGMIGDSGDEGIDLCYLFVNGKPIYDDTFDINNQSKATLKLFQIKKEDSFSTDGFRKFVEGIEEIFTLDLSLNKLQKIGVNKDLLDKIELIRNIFRKTRKEMASFSLECFFATVAISEDYSEKIKYLQEKLKKFLSPYSIPIDFHYWTAQHLLDFTDKKEDRIEFQFEGQPLMIAEKDILSSGYVGFINGNKLIDTLKDDTGRFKDELTDGNIRFFLGEDKQINSSIIDTALSEEKAKNFWAMNNGITIIGEEIIPSTRESVIVKNPQIVNGCQTVHCLYSAYKKDNKNILPKYLKVFVKLIKTDNNEINSEIISATNSQNPVKSVSLKANESIQRNIENHLITRDIYYERRENYYKRQGKTGFKVISLVRLTQIMHSIINKEAITAVNDTTTIIDSENKYTKLFHDKVDYDLYLFGCELYLKLWSMKNSDIRSGLLDEKQKDIVSKGGYLLLAILSSLILSDAEFSKNGERCKEICYNVIDISVPVRKNVFSLRKDSIFRIINDDMEFEHYYDKAKNILFKAVERYENKTSKNYVKLFKVRTFDKDYLMPAIENYFKNR